jgi:hypothetical protein
MVRSAPRYLWLLIFFQACSPRLEISGFEKLYLRKPAQTSIGGDHFRGSNPHHHGRVQEIPRAQPGRDVPINQAGGGFYVGGVYRLYTPVHDGGEASQYLPALRPQTQSQVSVK